jgi:hypothetical protein
LKTAVVVDTKLQTHVTPEMFGEGYEIAVAAMNGTPLLSQNFWKHLFCKANTTTSGEPLHPLDPKTLAQGASTTLYAALAPKLRGKRSPLTAFPPTILHNQALMATTPEHSGAFLQNCADSSETLLSHAKGASNRDQLWALSEKLVGEIFAYA